MNLIIPSEINDFEKFNTELSYVLQLIGCCESKKKMREFVNNNPLDVNIPKEAKAMIESVTGLKIKDEYVEGGIINMCRALDECKLEGVEEEKMRVIKSMIYNGASNEIIALAGYTYEDIDKIRKILAENVPN